MCIIIKLFTLQFIMYNAIVFNIIFLHIQFFPSHFVPEIVLLLKSGCMRSQSETHILSQ